jgi:hypothetical protein
VYAVAGHWSLDPSKSEQQAEALTGIVAGVRQLPGFVRGFWSRDVADSSANLTWIVSETMTRRPSGPHRDQEPSPA